jgi:hypothetical protein
VVAFGTLHREFFLHVFRVMNLAVKQSFLTNPVGTVNRLERLQRRGSTTGQE